tara:strand:- start:856 stop:1809 length:954 start_codon:yes stop_codon:yes gene_type:complete
MVITSGGIYGFLSGAYQSTATQSELLDKSLVILNQKNIRFQETKEDLSIEKQGLTKSISDLRIALSNPAQVQYIDKESGTLITTSSSSARRALQSELKTTITERDGINLKIEAVMDSINKTDMVLLDKEISNEAESELGPLKYLAEVTGKPMNQVVNWFLLLIIFVFDPLAIALVVAANFAFDQIKRRDDEEECKKENLNYEEQILEQEKITDEYLQDLEPYINHTEDNLDIDENRMNVIGQNGNDGLHYENIDSEKIKPINPTEKDLEKLSKVLNIKYDDENVPLERLTDTTQTLITKTVDENKDEKTKLKYKGRK